MGGIVGGNSVHLHSRTIKWVFCKRLYNQVSAGWWCEMFWQWVPQDRMTICSFISPQGLSCQWFARDLIPTPTWARKRNLLSRSQVWLILLQPGGLSPAAAGRAGGRELGMKMGVHWRCFWLPGLIVHVPAHCSRLQPRNGNMCTKMGRAIFGTVIALVLLWGVAEDLGLSGSEKRRLRSDFIAPCSSWGRDGEREVLSCSPWDPVTEHMGVFKAASRTA